MGAWRAAACWTRTAFRGGTPALMHGKRHPGSISFMAAWGLGLPPATPGAATLKPHSCCCCTLLQAERWGAEMHGPSPSNPPSKPLGAEMHGIAPGMAPRMGALDFAGAPPPAPPG